MVRLLAVATVAIVFSASARAAEIAPGHNLDIGIDTGLVSVDALPAWTDAGVGKLRYGDNGLVLSGAFADYQGRWADTLDAHVVLQAYDDELGSSIDLTQAWLEWRPVPSSANRYRVRAGMFYPHISLENLDAAWNNHYTVSSAAINTWLAEEIRILGVEASVSRRPVSLGGQQNFRLDIAAFRGNDPAGSLLVWKGWSVHDRQSRLRDRLPLAPLPQIQTGTMFELQDPYVEPFREIDGRTGFYAGAEWQSAGQFLLRLGHYDNRADPTALKGGQYAWHTEFDHAGMQLALPQGAVLLAQWMRGTTVMGPAIYANGIHAVDARYDSVFVLLGRQFGAHRVALRYDDFAVIDRDATPNDDNAETGHTLSLAYQVTLTDRLALAAEGLSITTHREAWSYFGLQTEQSELQWQLLLRLRL